MNMREAFIDTLGVASDGNMPFGSADDPLSFAHLCDMLDRIEAADEAGTPFSEAKLGRWLAWAQCAAVAANAMTLNEAKTINQYWSER
jgi:hypothetical protein